MEPSQLRSELHGLVRSRISLGELFSAAVNRAIMEEIKLEGSPAQLIAADAGDEGDEGEAVHIHEPRTTATRVTTQSKRRKLRSN